ncbi:hypothetical protein KCU78_g1547, partial [Aureobasidium melanogenum]
MKIFATLLTVFIGMGMHMSAAVPINSTTKGITVDTTHSTNLTNATTVDIEPPICGGTPPASAFNAPFDATTGEVINTTTAEIFTELSRVNPVKRHHPSFWKGDPCCTLISCHRKKECDIPEWDESQYYQRCGWCENPVPPPPEDM